MKACFHTALEWRTEKKIPETFKGPFMIWKGGEEFEIITTPELLIVKLEEGTVKKWTLLPYMGFR